MKTCLVCGAQAKADATTCAHCGEGSWSAVEQSPKPDADKGQKPKPGGK